MGSQTFDILRQGVWASFTGGWFYDPRQNVFCNAVHLYLWLFFLCTPFFTYLYFPRTTASWIVYGTLNVCVMVALKVVNMALHVLYDRSQEMADSSTKKTFRDSDCGAIEMQVLGFENIVNASAQVQPYESSTVNSVVSFDCADNNPGTIDFKVEVHRKNSSGSNESVGEQPSEHIEGSIEATKHSHQIATEHHGESNVENSSYMQYDCYPSHDGKCKQHENMVQKKSANGESKQFKNKLMRQNSLDISEIENNRKSRTYMSNEKSNASYFDTPILQRHNSSDNAENNRNRSISSNSFNDQRSKILKNNAHLYSESDYTKSDLGIENLEKIGHKFPLEPCRHMRKDVNSTTSALQLPLDTTSSNHARKRRHSNTGNKSFNNASSGVRRIKSAALDISSHQPSVSNLCLHPNSAEAISARQSKNLQNSMFPPPSKCLIRNPHLNLCPEMSSFSGMDPVYPIVEQGDEKNAIVEDNDGKMSLKNARVSIDDHRCSITESESDMDRPHCRSTDSDMDMNGSSSPLLHKSVSNDQCKIERNIVCPLNMARMSNKDCVMWSRNKSVDSSCVSSDMEPASESSREMYTAVNSMCQSRTSHQLDSGKVYHLSEKLAVSQKESKNLGAIPKTSRRSGDACIDGDDVQSIKHKTSEGNGSPSMSLRSFSCENFDNEMYKPGKDQWLIIGHSKRENTASSNMLPTSNDFMLSTHARLAITEGNYKVTPILTRSNAIKRPKKSEDLFKDIGDFSAALDSENDDAQTIQNTAFSMTDFMQMQYKEQLSSHRPTRGAVLNFRREEFNESGYCDYWRPRCSSIGKPIPAKRYYRYRMNCFGSRDLKIKMDRLQLLALFDRDLNVFHVLLSVFLSLFICFLGSTILSLGIYKDFSVFLFCSVIAGSQYSLLKSVQPDASSPVHGFNKTVAYSRPIYFCLFSALLLLSQYAMDGMKGDRFYTNSQSIYGINFVPLTLLEMLTNSISILLLLFPILFSLGMFPQFNTFCMYALEQIDMYVFGGTAVCSLIAAILCVFKSIIAVCLIYGPLYGSLAEKKSTQHVWFSIFCAILISLCYHLSRCTSDFSHIWSLVKANLFNYADDEEDISKSNSEIFNNKKENDANEEDKNVNESNKANENISSASTHSLDSEQADFLLKELQLSINSRLKNDLVVCSAVAIFVFALHSTTVFTVLQPDLNNVLFAITAVIGFFIHYLIPQMRKHLPWLCFAHPILKQREFGMFEVGEASKIMWFENLYVYLCFVEKNILYPLIFISTLTADSQKLINKFGEPLGTTVIAVCALKGVRSSYADAANQYLILSFCVLLFKFDFSFASETFLLDYFVISTVYRKFCDFLLKVQFVITYIAPWQITWGSAFHAFAQPFSVPHSAMLFLQMVLSAILSTPLNPFLGSAIFLTSYARPIKFWERDYNTRRIDHSNTRLSSQLEKDLGADDNNLNSIFYEHLTKSLQHSLCGDLLLGRWGNVNQGDCFVLASDYLNCLVHIIELGNGLCTFQMRGLEFRGTYCQQREVEAISEGIEENDGCCCCSPGHLPNMLSANAMFSTRWLAWQVVAAQYVLEGYSISENLATATLQLFEFRKVLITYYIKSIIYYVAQSNKLNEWLAPGPIQEALESTLNRQFVDLDPIFNYNLDEDFDFRALGITRGSFCCVYLNWIQFCYSKRIVERRSNESLKKNAGVGKDTQVKPAASSQASEQKPLENQCEKPVGLEEGQCYDDESALNVCSITKDSQLVSLCLALGLLARRSLATASHGSLSSVEFFLHGLHALFKGDFRITSPRDEWVFADMELLHGVVAPAVKMGLKLHQDHFSSPDEYLDPTVLYDAIKSHTEELVISHEADPAWRSAVLRGAPNLLALRHVMEDGSDEYRIIRLTKRFLTFRVIKLNRECVRGLWAGQQQELVYLRNRNPERGSIQNAKQALRNIINSSCDQPIGYPIYVSSLTTSYAETNEKLRELIGGSITLDSIQSVLEAYWKRIKRRCQEGCSSGSGVLDSETPNELPATYYLSNSTANFTVATCGSQTLPCSSVRGSVANVNKPTNPSLLVGFLNREREQDREFVRERSNKKTLSLKASDKTDREKMFISTTMAASNPECSSNFLEPRKIISCPGPATYTLKIASNASEHLPENLKQTIEIPPDNILLAELYENSEHLLLEVNKKVIIVDGTEIFDCLDLGRRIDVIWPNEEMRLNGGKSSWKDWSPKEGMVGFVVHYWQPNHPDQRFRSNVNRTLYLVAIGDRFVPVGEHGIKEYKQISLDLKITKTLTALNNTELETTSHFSIADYVESPMNIISYNDHEFNVESDFKSNK